MTNNMVKAILSLIGTLRLHLCGMQERNVPRQGGNTVVWSLTQTTASHAQVHACTQQNMNHESYDVYIVISFIITLTLLSWLISLAKPLTIYGFTAN